MKTRTERTTYLIRLDFSRNTGKSSRRIRPSGWFLRSLALRPTALALVNCFQKNMAVPNQPGSTISLIGCPSEVVTTSRWPFRSASSASFTSPSPTRTSSVMDRFVSRESAVRSEWAFSYRMKLTLLPVSTEGVNVADLSCSFSQGYRGASLAASRPACRTMLKVQGPLGLYAVNGSVRTPNARS